MRRRTAAIAVVGIAGLLGALAVPPGHAGSRPAAAAQASQEHWVTLITGDRVLVRQAGGRTDVTVTPAQRPGPAGFVELTRRGDRYVVPGDAAPKLRAGILDWELFNVSGLVRQGYDDQRTASLPLLVKYTGTRSAAPEGTTLRRALPKVRIAAVDEKKSTAAAFWRGLPTSIQKVWLNARIRASLDESVTRIGAPAAWARDLTGAGVTVAVLDTGIDADHPDFAGRLGPTKDFSGKGNVDDGNGHGTHVASTVAGSGAASDGKYKGVAPGATIAVGKVLDDSGDSTADTVIAGMQWAATEAKAKIVNMSLGGRPTDGSDPVSDVLNTLSREYGTLFVVAAGNDGVDEGVSSPAVADEALAVGSVSKSDVLSGFSNRGPRLVDGAVKPDIAAPGEAIVAARPSGVPPRGEPVGDAYQRLDGTSMATPHVAGAAALLAQRHPGWKGDALKAALMSTATEVPDAGPYAVGTGRVDADRATRQAVTATGSVSAYLRWPNLPSPNQGAREEKVVTWRNTGPAGVTLALDVNLTELGGLVSLSASSVTVPAGGTASVRLTVAARADAHGTYSGILTARGADGTVTRTALSVRQEPELYDLTVKLVDRNGTPVSDEDSGSVIIFNLDDQEFDHRGGPGTVRLPPGRYALHSVITTPRAGQEPSYSFISHPELTVGKDTTVTLDARDGKPISVTPPNPAARGGNHIVKQNSRITSCDCMFSVTNDLDPRLQKAYAATVPGTASPSFAFAQSRRAYEPRLELFTRGAQRFEVAAGWLRGSPEPAEQANLTAVYGGAGTPEDLAKIDARGKLVLFEVPGETTYEEVYRRTEGIKKAGARVAMVNVADERAYALLDEVPEEEPGPALPTLRGYSVTGARFAALVKAGATSVSYTSRPLSASRYELAYAVRGKVTTPQVHRPRTRDLVAVRTAYHDNVADSRRYFAANTEIAGVWLGGGWTGVTKAPQERVEYFTPGTWELHSNGYWGPRDEMRETVRLEVGGQYRLAWNKAVSGPAFPDGSYAVRRDGALDVTLPMYSDGAGHARIPFDWDTDTGSIKLYRDGNLVGEEPVPHHARFAVPPEQSTYRLEVTTSRSVDWWPLSTSVSAAWTFRSSAAGEGAALPLLTVRFDPAVDLRNRAPGGTAFRFPATVNGSGARVTSLAVDVSYDDGRTWTPATVTRSGVRWSVAVNHPATGYASLRAKATDANGNTVTQTILRAYALS
jgi:subtilisin family serine protease